MIRDVFLRTPFNYDTDIASEESGLDCKDASRAKQSFKEECDINVIAKNFGLYGELPTGIRMPRNVDFEGVFDFQSAMNVLIAAQESFEQMPAEVRKRFGNDPANFVEFCSDEKNREEALKLGLVEKAVVVPEKVMKVEVVQPAGVPLTKP